MTYQTDAPIQHHSLGATNRFADFYVRAVQEGLMLLDAPYQRGDVWTVEQRMGLVRSWLMGVPIPVVIINDRMSPFWEGKPLFDRHGEPERDGYAYSVIDGKQRIQTAIMWLGGELAVPASWFPAEHVETTEDTDDGPYVRFTGLTAVGRRFADSRCVLPCAEGKLPTVEHEAEVYGLVNGAGTPQTGEDMARAAAVAAGHVTYIERPDGAGHFSWCCVKNDGDGTGYEEAAEVMAAATAHGPLAADSYIPRDEDVED